MTVCSVLILIFLSVVSLSYSTENEPISSKLYDIAEKMTKIECRIEKWEKEKEKWEKERETFQETILSVLEHRKEEMWKEITNKTLLLGNGSWALWEPWGVCSATCGGGMRSRTRTCTNQSSSVSGKFCNGDTTQYASCNQECCQCSQMRKQRFGEGAGVAFTAYLSKSVSHLGHQHTIPFDRVFLNEGQGFNTVTHIFTCPVTGTYIFQTALMSERNTLAITEIVKDGTQLVQAYAKQGGGHAQGYNSVITTCNRNDSVWVRNFQHYGHSVYSERYTTFSGFLLWESE